MKHLKQALLATAGGLLLAGSASAADLPLRAAPAAIPYSSWSGLYVGAHIGAGGASNTCGSGAGGSEYDCAGQSYSGFQNTRDTNIVGGVQAGYDWQNRNFVWGIAADWTWTNIKTNAYGVSGSISYESKVNWLASFRGRAGLAVDDTMIYVTGGLGLGDFSDTTVKGSPSGQFTNQNIWVGWVAGMGLEHKFSQHWSVAFEYLHYDFGSKDYTATPPGYSYQHTFSHVVDVGRVGLNYRF